MDAWAVELNEHPVFLVLLGIDGSGKSTLLEHIDLPGLVATSWRELRSHEVPATLAPDAPTRIKNRLPSLSRAMFIGGHLVAQYEYLVRPDLEDGANVLLDSYYFKLLAKERLFGTVHPALEQLCAELPPPDGVIYIDVSPETSYYRKQGELSPYEYVGTPNAENYLRFQTDLAREMRELISPLPHFRIDGEAAESEVLSEINAALAELQEQISLGRGR